MYGYVQHLETSYHIQNLRKTLTAAVPAMVFVAGAANSLPAQANGTMQQPNLTATPTLGPAVWQWYYLWSETQPFAVTGNLVALPSVAKQP